MPSIAGAPRNQTWCRTAVNASSTARRSSRPGATGRPRPRQPNVRAGTCPSLRIPRSVWRCTSRVSCTGSAAGSARRSSRTAPRSEQGREPAPGMALLRLAEGRVDAAISAGRRMVDESRGQPEYPKMLAAYTEILIAADDLDTAAVVADELARDRDDGRDAAPPRDGRLRKRFGAPGRG